MTFARTRWRVARHRLVAVLALATAASVLVPLASPAGATTASVVTLTRQADAIFEGGTAVYTFHATPPPAADLDVTYTVSDGSVSGSNHITLRDGQAGTKTVRIAAGQTSATIQIQVRDDTLYRWTGETTAKAQRYGTVRGIKPHYCLNDSNGLPYRNPPVNKPDDVQEVLHGDKQCASIFGHLSNPTTEKNWRGKVWVTITGVGPGGKIGTQDDGHTTRLVQVRDRSLWKDRLKIVQPGGDTSVAENGGTDTYTVALTQKPSSDVTVTVTSAKPAAATVKTTGAAGATATLTFTASNWSQPQTVTVTGVDDDVVQGSGKRTTAIKHAAKSSDRNYEGVTEELTATVTDDDAAKAVINLTTDVTSVNEDVASAQTVTVTATLANSLTFDAAKTVNVSVPNSSQADPVQFAASPNAFAITIPAGQSSATNTFDLTPTDNNASSSDGVVTISGISGSTTVNPAKIALVDDETSQVPRVSISVDHSTIKETGTPNKARVTLTVNKAPSQEINIGYSVSSDSAVQDQDYTGLDEPFKIGTDRLTTRGFITALNDTVTDEGAETVTVTLTEGTGYRLGPNKSVTITIEDNTAAPSQPVVKFSRANPNIDPENPDHLGEDWGTENVQVMLDPVPASAITLNYGLSGTATLDSDYSISGVTGATATLSVPAYSKTVGIPVSIIDDALGESDETVVLTLTSGTGYTLGTAKVYTATIVDNDSGGTSATPGVTVSKSNVVVTETEIVGDATYTVVLDSEPASNVTIRATVSTFGSEAPARVSGGGGFSVIDDLTFTRTNWETPQTVTVRGYNDEVDNSGDKRTVTISHTVNTGDGDGYQTTLEIDSVTVEVTDIDTAGVTVTESGTPAGTAVAENGGTDTYTVVLDSKPASDVAVTVTSPTPGVVTVNKSGGTAGASQTLTFTPSDWNQAQTVTVTGVNDNVDNPGDKRTVTVSHAVTTGDGSKYTTSMSVPSVTVTVTDDDDGGPRRASVTLTVSVAGGGSVTEGTAASFTLTADEQLSQALAVFVTVSAQGDFGVSTGSRKVVISAGKSSETLTVTTRDDSTDEAHGWVMVAINDHSDYTVSSSAGSAKVNVTDDDPAPPQTRTTPTPPSASFGSGSYPGGEASGSGNVSVPVNLSAAAPAGGLTVGYTVGGTAVPGSDYTGVSSSVSIGAGQSSAMITVTILDDAVDENDETVVLTLNTGSGYTRGSPMSTTVTITDNDDPAPKRTQTPSTNGNTGSTSNSDTSQRSSNSGTSSQGAPSAPPEVELRLGPASAGSISLGESSEMTVELERAVRRWVRVFIEIDSTASLTDDYTVDADVGDGWVSLGENPRRLTFDLPPEDTDARVRVTSRDSSGPDTSVTLSVTIGDRSFAASSVVTIVPVGEAEIVSSGDPDASDTDDDGADGDGDGEDGEVVDGDGDGADGDGDDDGADDGVDGDGEAEDDGDDADDDDSDGDDEAEDDGDDAEDDSADVDDSGHAVEPESLGSVVRTDDGWFVLYTVEPGDTLRSIALTFYRDDESWRGIYAANRGRRMSDGYTLTSADMIRAGWILRVPLPISAPSSAAAADASYVIYCVMQGDMLGTIAQRIYGDSSLYNRIVLANRGQRQADGQTFVHGDRIDVGWLLRIPVAGA